MINWFNDNPLVLLSMTCCIWPLVWFGLGFVAGKFRPRIRSPFVFRRKSGSGEFSEDL